MNKRKRFSKESDEDMFKRVDEGSKNWEWLYKEERLDKIKEYLEVMVEEDFVGWSEDELDVLFKLGKDMGLYLKSI